MLGHTAALFNQAMRQRNRSDPLILTFSPKGEKGLSRCFYPLSLKEESVARGSGWGEGE